MLKLGHLSNVGIVTVDRLSHTDIILHAVCVDMHLEIKYGQGGTVESVHYFSTLSNYPKERGTEVIFFSAGEHT